MSGAEIKQYILQLEERFPVNTWQVFGVDLWPHIRIKLYIFLLNLRTEKKLQPFKNPPVFRKKHIPERILNGVKKTVKAWFELYGFYKSLEPKKILFFGAHFHRTRQNGLYFNRFFDSMVDTYQLQKEVYTIEFGKLYEKNYNQESIIDLHKYLDQYKIIQKLKNFCISSRNEGSCLDSYSAFYEQVKRDFSEVENLNISPKRLESWAKKVRQTQEFFTRLYRQTAPEKVIFLSYYGYDDLAAAILAAQKLGIKTVDFQHGPQTNVHMAYSAWTKHPEKPYNTMPVEYWNWDSHSKSNIEEWAESHLIKAKVAGHPYMAYHEQSRSKRKEPERVFFSLQTFDLEEMLPLPLLDIIKTSHLVWVFRMHPRSNFSRKTFESFLIKNGISLKSCEIEEASDSPLPKSLIRAKIHLTNFSGCTLEAQILNVPSVLLHKSGKEMFKGYIDDENVFFLDPYQNDFEVRFNEILNHSTSKSQKSVHRDVVNPLHF